MIEEERTAALSMARRKAVEYATASESPIKLRDLALTYDAAVERANMWAAVAQALKSGGIPEPDPVITREWSTT